MKGLGDKVLLLLLNLEKSQTNVPMKGLRDKVLLLLVLSEALYVTMHRCASFGPKQETFYISLIHSNKAQLIQWN